MNNSKKEEVDDFTKDYDGLINFKFSLLLTCNDTEETDMEMVIVFVKLN